MSLIMDEVYEKIVNNELNTINEKEHKLIYTYRGQQFEWTKKLWSYINSNKRVYWPDDYTRYFFEWNSNMIEYYKKTNTIYKQIFSPTIVIFEYDVYMKNRRMGATGKYTHYNSFMTQKIWNEKKENFKEKIRIKLARTADIYVTTDSIKIYNIRVKIDTIYEGDDDGYSFIYKESSVNKNVHITNYVEMPSLPEELSRR